MFRGRVFSTVALSKVSEITVQALSEMRYKCPKFLPSEVFCKRGGIDFYDHISSMLVVVSIQHSKIFLTQFQQLDVPAVRPIFK